jgi:phage-related protein
MRIIEYTTAGGKNLIKEYLNDLPEKDRIEANEIRRKILLEGYNALKDLNTRQLKGKLWEIKFSQNRIMYVVQQGDTIYFLHACKKQKNKAEKPDIDLAIRRAKEYGLRI